MDHALFLARVNLAILAQDVIVVLIDILGSLSVDHVIVIVQELMILIAIERQANVIYYSIFSFNFLIF